MFELALAIYLLFGLGLGVGLFSKEAAIWAVLCLAFWPFFLGAFIGIVLQMHQPCCKQAEPIQEHEKK